MIVRLTHTAAPGFQRWCEFRRTQKNMMQRYLVMASAWLEIVVGAILLTVPNAPCLLLFGAKL